MCLWSLLKYPVYDLTLEIKKKNAALKTGGGGDTGQAVGQSLRHCALWDVAFLENDMAGSKPTNFMKVQN